MKKVLYRKLPSQALVMRLSSSGIKPSEIARRLGCSRDAVSAVLREAKAGAGSS